MSAHLDRKLAGKCTWSARCRRPLAPDCDMCERHHKRKKRQRSKSAAAARDNNRALGLCAFCPTSSETYRCAVCAAKHGQVPASVRLRMTTGVGTDSDPWRKDSDGWKRYRGKGRRGPPAAAVNDEQDLKDAERALEKGRQALAYARSPEVQALPRIQRAGVKSEAVAFLAHAARFLDEVVDRNGGSE